MDTANLHTLPLIWVRYIYIIHSDLLYYSLKASDDEFWKEQGDMIQIVKPLWKKKC